MIKLKNIILERIIDVHRLQSYQAQTSNQQIKNEKDVQQWLQKLDGRELQRLRAQIIVMKEMQFQSNRSQDLTVETMAIMKEIMEKYNCDFRQYCQQKRYKYFPSRFLYKIIQTFVSNDCKSLQFRYISSYIHNNIYEINPIIYVGLLSQWSRTVLNNLSKGIRQVNSVCFTLQIQLAKFLRLKTEEQQMRDKNIQNFIYRSKQNLYGYFYNEMESYYKRYDILDLDPFLLKSISKVNKKDEMFTSNTAVETESYITKHHIQASVAIKLYAEQYQKYKNKKLRRKIKSLETQPMVKITDNRFASIKSMSNKTNQVKLFRQIEESIEQYKLKSSKKNSKVLFQQHHHRIEFPLISQITREVEENINNRRIFCHSQKKSIKKIWHTEPEKKIHLRGFQINQGSNSKEKKRSPNIVGNSSKFESMPVCSPKLQIQTGNDPKFDDKFLYQKFDRRYLNAMKKVREKAVDLSKRQERVHIKTTLCYNDSIIKKCLRISDERRLFISEGRI